MPPTAMVGEAIEVIGDAMRATIRLIPYPLSLQQEASLLRLRAKANPRSPTQCLQHIEDHHEFN